MSEQELNEIIAQNITDLLESRGKTQFDLAEYMEVSQATISNWCNGIKMPRMDKIDRICEFFGVKRSQLMEPGAHEPQSYYLDPDAAAFAQEIADRPGLRALFSAARDVNEEDLRFMVEMAERFKKESGED